MRLTLRTLLAYLDDTLPSEEAKLIGQKVAESKMAQELIDRIKKVTRRRSLASPPVQGDTSRLDPNTVAEYLDGVLVEDDLAQTEQVCLDDDVYLAEVAACHQILTLMLSEPARVPPPARQRIYQLVKGRESIPNRKAPSYYPNGSTGAESGSDVHHHRKNRLLAALATIAVLAVLLVAAVVLAWPKSDSRQVAKRGDSANGTQPRNREPAPASTTKSPESDKGVESDQVAAPTKKAEVNKPADLTKPESPKTPAGDNAPKAEIAAKPEPNTAKATPASEKPADAARAQPKKPLDVVPLDPPDDEIKDIAQLVSVDSVLAERSSKDKLAWRLVPPNGRVLSGVPIVCLPGNRNDVKLDSGMQVSLLALEFIETIITLNEPPPNLAADVTLDHGRVIFTNTQKEAPARLRLRFRSEIWDLTIAPQSDAFVDGISKYELGDRFSKQAGVESPKTELFVSVPRGKVSIQIRDREPIELKAPPGPGIVGWDNRGRLRPPAELRAPIPQWSADQQARTSMKDDYKSVLNGFIGRLSQPDASIELGLKELAESTKPLAQVYAAYALTALDIIGPDVDALDDLFKPDMRAACVLALRNWIARSPENPLVLHQMLQQKKNYSEPQADTVLQLLHSFSEADAMNPETYNHLFRWLASEKLAIRELAYWHLERLDPDGVKPSNYFPAMTDGREAAINRWRKRLTDGKIIPKPPKPAPVPAEPKPKESKGF